MRNLKRALSLGLTAAMISGLMVMGSSAASSSYTDVADTDNVEAIEVLKTVGIMIGDESGDFNPDQNVTRNEMAVVMSNLMAYNVASYKDTSPFTDVPSWAEPYVAACYTNGITAGTSATTYGGSENVTTAQAALMLMKALGYFQYSSDFGSDWQLSTATQGNKIDLFVGVDSALKEAMTRNDLAQLVLNTLEAGTVEAETDGSFSVGDVTFVSGVKYNYVTSGEKYADSIEKSLTANTDASVSFGKIVQLGEKLYQGDLTKEEGYDDFGRPANVWEYQSKEIGTFAKTADYTYTAKVTSKALYNEVGKTATDNYEWTVSFNGESVKYEGENLSANKTDDDKDFVQKALGGDARTGNGVITEVYVDGTDKTVDIAIIEYYAAEVYEVNEDDGTITLSDFGYGPADNNDEYDSTDFKEDQIVMYSFADGEIQDVYAAEQMSGEVTRVRSNTTGGDEADGDNFVVDGTTYKYNKTMDSADRLVTENVKNNVVAYLDANGYVAYIDESAMTYDYAYVLSMGTSDDQYGGGDAGETVYARLVLTDGTLVKVETDVKSTDRNDYVNHIVSYSADKNKVYSLTVRDYDNSDNSTKDDKGTMRGTDGLQPGTDSSKLKIENGVASFYADGDRYTANSNTVFIVADSDDKLDDYDFTVYTGIKNVPDIDFAKNAGVDVAATEDSVAKVVYVQDADVSGAGNVIFARADKNAKLVKDSETGNYYEINAVVDGKTVTLNVKENSTAADRLVNSIGTYGLDIGGGRRIIALDSVTENADGLVTTVSRYEKIKDGDGYDIGTRTGKAENETVLLDDERFAWDDDVVVVRYNYKGDFEVSRINSIKTDSNDQYVAVMDSNVIAGICIIEKDGGENDSNTPSGDVKDTILVQDVDNDSALEVHYYGDKPAMEDVLATIEDWLEDQGLTLKNTTISGGKYTFTCTSSRGYTYEYTWDRTMNDDVKVIIIDGKAVQYFVGKNEKIDMADYSNNGGTGFLFSSDNGKTFAYKDYANVDIDANNRPDNIVVKTGYITVTDASKLASGYTAGTPNYMEAEGELTITKAGTYKINDEVVTTKSDKETYTVGNANVTIVEWQTASDIKSDVAEAVKNNVTTGSVTNGTVAVSEDGMTVTIIQQGGKIKDTGLLKMAKALIDDGYTVKISGSKGTHTVDGSNLGASRTAIESLLPAVGVEDDFTVTVTSAKGESVNYTVIFNNVSVS